MAYEQNDGGFPQRQTYKVDEKCADCGAAITELPFQPDAERRNQLRCRDCYRKRRDSFRRDDR